MNRVRALCNLAILTVLPMSLYYLYSSGGWALDVTFLRPERWMESDWVHPDAVIGASTRFVFLILWGLPVILGVTGYAVAVRLAFLVRGGMLFDPRVARHLVWIGVWVISSAVAKVIAACLSPMVRSWHNPDGPLPLRFWYGSEEFGLIFCGIGFVIFGLVMHEAIKIARENEGFV